jgi:hypothetical protein
MIPLCFAACTGSNTDATTAANKDSATVAPGQPSYKVDYSSIYSGKQTDVLTVLNNLKAWETTT